MEWPLLVVCLIALPFEMRRFYRSARQGDLNWWAVVDIMFSLGLIAVVIANAVNR